MNFLRMIRESISWKLALSCLASLLFIFGILSILVHYIPFQRASQLNLIDPVILTITLSTFLSLFAVYLTANFLIRKPLKHLLKVSSHPYEEERAFKDGMLKRNDEIGGMARLIDGLLDQLEDLEERRMKMEKQLFQAQEELQFKKTVHEQNAMIEETNRQLARRVKDLSALYRIGQLISSTLDPRQLDQMLIDEVIQTLDYKEFVFLAFDEEAQLLRVKLASGFADNEKIKQLTFALGEGITGKVAQEQKRIYIADTSKEPNYLHYKGEKMEEGSFLSIPVAIQGRLLGVMNFFRPEIDSFSLMDIKLLISLASQIAVAMENAALYSKMKELAVTDELTQLYNRRHFETMLQMEWRRAKRFNRAISVLLIDVDHFKRYNDEHGHGAGDQALREIAALFSKNIREVDTACRYGGEEFAIILTHTHAEDALQIAEKLRQLVSEAPFYFNGGQKPHFLSISVGISNYPSDAKVLEDLVAHADIALYEAKGAGRNNVQLYQEGKSSLRRMR